MDVEEIKWEEKYDWCNFYIPQKKKKRYVRGFTDSGIKILENMSIIEPK